ncbi:MAG: deaminase [Cryobacterium sp.]|nr:deaminase [Cryobacterium sp.]
MSDKADQMLDKNDIIAAYRPLERSVPCLRVNFIASIDGAATENGLSGALGNADDKLVFDTLRMLSDVIVVGAGTVRAEGYGGIRLDPADLAWRVENSLPAQPPTAVVSARLDLDPSHPFFVGAAVRPLVITHEAAPAERRRALAEVADVLLCGDRAVDTRLMITALAERGLLQVLCEGGPTLFGSLIEADCVDELCLTLSPVLEGGTATRIVRGTAQTPRALTLRHAMPAGDMLFLRYARAR